MVGLSTVSVQWLVRLFEIGPLARPPLFVLPPPSFRLFMATNNNMAGINQHKSCHKHVRTLS